jgi:uncharacterized protein YndB with AHSA1/START domain
LEQRTVVHSTFVIERSYPVAPQRVFAAFADPVQKCRWFAEGDHHDVEEFETDFREGDRQRACYRFRQGTPIQGMTITDETTFQDIVPNRRIVFTSTMRRGDERISATLATVELVPSGTGTNLILTHQGAFFEGADGPQMREMGWRHLLDRLGHLLAEPVEGGGTSFPR